MLPPLAEIESLSVPSYRLEDSSVELVCRYLVEEQRLGELDIKWYLDSSPSPWLVHLPHHWTLPHIVRGSRLADHVSQVIDWHHRDSVAATPAFLCHKVTAQGFQSHLLGVFFPSRCFFMAKEQK